VALAQAFIAVHWGEEFVSGHDKAGQPLRGVNALTSPAFCPQSKQPEFKHAAVRLERVELPWQLIGVAWLPADQVQAERERLRTLLAGFDYASCVPFGHEPQGRTGLRLRAAALAHPGDAVMEEVEAALGLDRGDRLRYVDSRRGQQRTIRFAAAPGEPAAAAALDAFMLAGDVQAEPWLHALLQDGAPARHFGHALLSGLATGPGAASPARSAQVCNCFDVSESAITSTLAQCHGSAEMRLAQLQRRLHCGTQCGSCLPALRALVQQPGHAPARGTEPSASVA
jgi:assimilatory nitrate reductase catalytic subunit